MEEATSALAQAQTELQAKGLSAEAARLSAPYVVFLQTGKSVAELLRNHIFESESDRHAREYTAYKNKQALQNYLINSERNRDLTSDQATHVAGFMPKVVTMQYLDVPGVDQMHADMGMEPDLQTDVKKYQKAKSKLFDKQPVRRVPIDALTLTQTHVHKGRVEDMSHDAETLNSPVQVIKHDQSHYLMDGHHRVAARHTAGKKFVMANVYAAEKAYEEHDYINKRHRPAGDEHGGEFAPGSQNPPTKRPWAIGETTTDPVTTFHGTSAQRLNSILKEGIKTGKFNNWEMVSGFEKEVFTALQERDAISFGRSAAAFTNDKKYAVLEVVIPPGVSTKLDKRTLGLAFSVKNIQKEWIRGYKIYDATDAQGEKPIKSKKFFADGTAVYVPISINNFDSLELEMEGDYSFPDHRGRPGKEGGSLPRDAAAEPDEIRGYTGTAYHGGVREGDGPQYFTTNKEAADSYKDMYNDRLGEGGQVSQAHITITKPAPWNVIASQARALGIDNETYTPASVFDAQLHDAEPVQRLVARLKVLGYDGAVLDDIAYGKQLEIKAIIPFNRAAVVYAEEHDYINKKHRPAGNEHGGEFAPKDGGDASGDFYAPTLFGEWAAVLDSDQLYGYRSDQMGGSSNLGDMAATEGVGIYIAKNKDTAEFFGKARTIKFTPPKNPLVVKGEPLYILNEDEGMMRPAAKTDSPWLAVNKEAVRRTGTTDENWGKKTQGGELQNALTDVIRERGYDSVYVSSGGEDWVVLIAPKKGGRINLADEGHEYFNPRHVPSGEHGGEFAPGSSSREIADRLVERFQRSPTPAEPTPQQARGVDSKPHLGQCYDMAGRYMMDHAIADRYGLPAGLAGARLIHGTVQNGADGQLISHAWVDLGDGKIFDGALQRFFDKDSYYKYFNAKEEQSYSHDEMAKAMLKYKHYGPWGETAGFYNKIPEKKGRSKKHSFPDHAGRPGHVGGSLPRGEGGASQPAPTVSDDPRPYFAHIKPPPSDRQLEETPNAAGMVGTEKAYRDEKTLEWDPEREAWHQAIAERYLEGKVPLGEKEATVLGGGMAVGKTTISKQIAGDNPNLVHVNADEIKLLIPEYGGLKESNPSMAGTLVHEESSYIAKLLLAKAAARGLNVVYDASSSGKGGPMMVKSLVDKGYAVHLAFADVPISMAQDRSNARAVDATDLSGFGRRPPADVLAASHRAAAANFLLMKDMPEVSTAQLFDTGAPLGTAPKLVYSRTGKSNATVLDRSFWDRYASKAEGKAE